ncbi:MAG TPA: hypothetical protein PLT66_04640 [Bacillota bacterium]|nr:hypothetical protein [Bacillota bacterium]
MILHETEKNDFSRAVEQGHVSHAYAIEGREGIGKLDFAMYCAKTILCEATDGSKPCGKCASCRKTDVDEHPDISVPQPDEGKKTLSIDQIREIRRDAYVVPNDGERKVYIFTDAHDMPGRNQNALLKIIEEPPEPVVFFFLVCSRSMLLPTVRSRRSFITLSPLNENSICEWLRQRHPKISADVLEDAARRSDGMPGRAEKLLEKDSVRLHDTAAELIRMLLQPSGRIYEFYSAVTALRYKQDGLKRLLEEMCDAFGDLLEAKYMKTSGFSFFSKEQADRYKNLASTESLTAFITVTDRLCGMLDSNPNMTSLLAYYAQQLWNNK